MIIATWWETAEWVAKMSDRAGKKVYFIQHHEVHKFLPPQRTRATYELPMRKIVVAKWLADVMREEYGDGDVDVVPNGVDHAQFHAPARGKQASRQWACFTPTSNGRGPRLALSVAQRLRERVPDLRVLCFGTDYPWPPLPGFVSFSFQPPQDYVAHPLLGL